MLKNIHRKYFEIWGDEQSQNIVLKNLLVFSTIINIALIISIIIFAKKKPFIISMEKNKTNVINISKKIPKYFLEKEIKKYYNIFYKPKT